MKKIDDAFGRMTSFENLDKAYRNARKQKRYRPEVLNFSNDLDSNLLRIQEQLRSGAFKFGPYRRHWVTIPKKRIVMALPFESRVVQWSVYQELMPFYDKLMIEDSYACRVNGGTLKAVEKLQYWMRKCARTPEKDWYIVKLDISKFFYRVDHEVLKRILWERIEDPELRNLLGEIIDSDGERFGLPRGMSAEDIEDDEWLSDVGMPIGNLTSQLFANIYLNELDHFAKHQLHLHMYERYMDDVIAIVPGKENARAALESMRKFLTEELKLDLNKKTTIRPLGRIEFVGYMVDAKHRKLRKQTVRRIKVSFKEISRKYFAGEMSKEDFDRRVASYKGQLMHCDSKQLKKRLNEIYLSEKQKAA